MEKVGILEFEDSDHFSDLTELVMTRGREKGRSCNPQNFDHCEEAVAAVCFLYRGTQYFEVALEAITAEIFDNVDIYP